MRCHHCGGPVLAQHESFNGYRPAAYVYTCAHCGRTAKEEEIPEAPRQRHYGFWDMKNSQKRKDA